MLTGFTASIRFVHRGCYNFGSYYSMVKFFSEVEAISGNKDKLSKIR